MPTGGAPPRRRFGPGLGRHSGGPEPALKGGPVGEGRFVEGPDGNATAKAASSCQSPCPGPFGWFAGAEARSASSPVGALTSSPGPTRGPSGLLKTVRCLGSASG